MSYNGGEDRRKADSLIWWLMITFAAIIILGGGAWAAAINAKVDKIAPMESNIQYIQADVNDIKMMIQREIRKGE